MDFWKGFALLAICFILGTGAASGVMISSNWNEGAVQNGPQYPTTFTFEKPFHLLSLETYHWNDGRGVSQAGSMIMMDEAGREYGPWQAVGSDGSGGVANAVWTSTLDEFFPAGTYAVYDSDPDTWSHNSESGYRGFARFRYEIIEEKDDPISTGQKSPGAGVLPENTPGKYPKPVIDYTFTSGLDDKTQPLDRNKDFSTTEKRAYFWLKAGPFNGGEKIEQVWIDPNGNEIYRSSSKVDDPADFGHDFWIDNYQYSYIYIAGKKAEKLPGTWKVELYIDGKFILSDTFTISGGKITPPEGAAPAPVISNPPDQSGKGTIQTGSSETLVSGQIPVGGGIIAVNKPGSALNGLTIDAGPDCWPAVQAISVSAAPIIGHSFGEYFNPVTPLITIDAGEGYTNEPVLVSIPVKISEDKFAMAFYYDAENRQLEGIPTVGQDSKSITIATRHFSDIVVSAIDLIRLNAVSVVDSGFTPKVDDWEFINNGSVVAPNGHCSGQSLTAMWYYIEQKKKLGKQSLNGRYDNNGREKTPCCGTDNTLGYRFASVIQKKYEEEWIHNRTLGFFFNLNLNTTEGLGRFGRLDNLTTFRLYKYSILLSGEPQIVDIRGAGAHEIVCYKVAGDTMYIADPNYPGTERTIALIGNALGPYSSGPNSQDIRANGARIYPRITYFAKTSYLNWSIIGEDYKKVLDGSIGDGEFPSYVLEFTVTGDNGSTEYFEFDGGKNELDRKIEVHGNSVNISVRGTNANADIWVNGRMEMPGRFDLEPGDNIFGIDAWSEMNNRCYWMGYDRVDLINQAKQVHIPQGTSPSPTTPCEDFDVTYDVMQNVGIGGIDQYRITLQLVTPEESPFFSYSRAIIPPGYQTGGTQPIDKGGFFEGKRYFHDYTEPGEYTIKVYKFSDNVQYDPWKDPDYPEVTFYWNPCGIITKTIKVPP
ncbi:MAG: hypothetical protein AB9879_06090 [Methanothrix sp.]